MGKVTAKLDSAYSIALAGDDYRGFDISYFEIDVDDELVNHRFEELLRQVSFQDVPSGPIRADDTVVVDYEGTVGADQVKAAGCAIRVGFGEYLEALERSLEGRQVGDSYRLSFTMPDVHVRAAWQKAPADIAVRVKSAKRPVPYEATDAYVASVSEFQTADELRQVIREQYSFEVQQESLRLLRVQASEKIGGLAKERFSDEELMSYAKAHLADEYPVQDGLSDEKRREVVDAAAFEVGWRNIARCEGISVDDDEVDAAYRNLKRLYRESGRSKKDMRKEARDGLLCEAVVDLVIDQASVSSLQGEGGVR